MAGHSGDGGANGGGTGAGEERALRRGGGGARRLPPLVLAKTGTDSIWIDRSIRPFSPST